MSSIEKFLSYITANHVAMNYHIFMFTEADYSDCPVFVYFYGGYWFLLRFTCANNYVNMAVCNKIAIIVCRKDNGGPMAVPFTKAGVIVVVVGHTPCINGKSTYMCMWL